jgi:hypothetical protein
MLNSLIDQLGQDLQMKDLILNPKEGNYTLPFDENIEVNITQTEHSYIFKGIIGACPKTNVETFFTKAMEANLFGRGTRNQSIGLSEDGNMLTLSGELDYNSTYREFKEKLEDFVSILDFWRKEALTHH